MVQDKIRSLHAVTNFSLRLTIGLQTDRVDLQWNMMCSKTMENEPEPEEAVNKLHIPITIMEFSSSSWPIVSLLWLIQRI